MAHFHKYGEDRSVRGLVPALITLVCIALIWLFSGGGRALQFAWAAFIIYMCLALWAFIRTRSVGYLASFIYLAACSLLLSLRIGLIPEGRDAAPGITILLMASIFFLIFMVLTKRTKWRGRDLLELAAMPVEEVSNGFSDRPRPAGKSEFTREDINLFARFSRRNLLGMTYHESDRIVFVLVKMGDEYSHLFNPRHDYNKDTWVAFHNNGNIVTRISGTDYRGYKEDFDFEDLSQSLSDLFLKFLHLYLDGNGSRILDQLDDMKIGVFS